MCGPERILAAEVAQLVREAAGAEEFVSLTAGAMPEREVWASALALPPDDGTRLVIVHDAGKLTRWGMLRDWLSAGREITGCWLVLDAAEDDYPHEDADGKPRLAAPCSWLRDSHRAQLVRCTTPSPADLVAWVRTRFPAATEQLAAHLLTRAGGDLAEVAAVCAKAALFGGMPSPAAVDVLCAERAGEDFADALVLGDKRAALLGAAALGPDLGRAIGLLASRLDTMALLYHAARNDVPRRDVTSRLGVPAFIAAKFAGAASGYSDAAVARRRRALAVADSAYQGGAREGVAEALAALW